MFWREQLKQKRNKRKRRMRKKKKKKEKKGKNIEASGWKTDSVQAFSLKLSFLTDKVGELYLRWWAFVRIKYSGIK